MLGSNNISFIFHGDMCRVQHNLDDALFIRYPSTVDEFRRSGLEGIWEEVQIIFHISFSNFLSIKAALNLYFKIP